MILKSTTILLPQDLGTGDSPTFVGLSLSGLTQNSIVFVGSGGLLSEDNTNLYWNDSSNYLRVPEIAGSDSSGGTLDLHSTSHATKGKINLGDIVYIDEVGNKLGIGTNAPEFNFELYDSTSVFAIKGANGTGQFRVISSNGTAASFNGFSSRGTISSPTATQSGDVLFNQNFKGYNSNATDYLNNARIRGIATEDMTSGLNAGGKVSIWTSANGTETPIENFIVDQDGSIILPSDDQPIVLGAGSDASIDYDSANNSLDIDLTGGVDTGLRILTDGDDTSIDGSTGDWLLGLDVKIGFRSTSNCIYSSGAGLLNLTAGTSVQLDTITFLNSVKSGATQGGAGASANEIWKTSSHASLPDNVLMIGV